MIVNWKSLKQHRGAYFVEYIPGGPTNYLSTLALTYVGDTPPPETIVADIEKEFGLWVSRFPVPLMATAVDENGDGVDLTSLNRDRFFMGYKDSDEIVSSWTLMKDEEIPEHLKNLEHRAEVYSSLEAVTREDVKNQQDQTRRSVKTGWIIVFLWGVVVPLLIAILGFLNIFFLGALAMGYSIYKAIKQGLEMLGILGPSEEEKKREAEEREMRHHHYHCKRNPEAFARLRSENFIEDEKQEIQRESKRLAKKDIAGR